jgi:uncharacterized membrane protein
MFNLAHIHIVLNHIPSLGCLAALMLLIAAVYTKNDGLKKFSFLALVLVAVSLLPTYITGAESQRMIRDIPTVSKPMIQVHQNAAMATLVMMTITGTLAWFGLWEFRRFARAGKITTIGTLVAASITVAMILGTASLGGKISHREVRDGADAEIKMEDGWREPIELFVSDHSWVWPAAETLHFLGMTSLFGVSLLLMMRMLGGVKSIPYASFHRLLPLGVIGFVVNVLTGMMFFIASPGLYLGKGAFHNKIACIVIAAVPILYFTVAEETWQTGGNKNSSGLAKVAAVSTFCLLLVVIIYGRLLPFLN